MSRIWDYMTNWGRACHEYCPLVHRPSSIVHRLLYIHGGANLCAEINTNRYSPLFVVVTGLFIACLVSANIISVKLIAVGGWFVPAGVVIFPVSYILGDVLTEVYGYRSARRVIWLG